MPTQVQIFRAIEAIFRELDRWEKEHRDYLNSPEYKAKLAELKALQNTKYAEEVAAEQRQIALAAQGALVDPLREQVIEELMLEGNTREVAENLTNTPTRLIALAQHYDFI